MFTVSLLADLPLTEGAALLTSNRATLRLPRREVVIGSADGVEGNGPDGRRQIRPQIRPVLERRR
jgi:hypothetical protein